MPQRDGPRLTGRNGRIWGAYLSGHTQARIADDLGLSQQRVSEVIAEVRAGIGESARVDAALLAQERTDALLAAVWPAAMAGDPRAVTAALRVLERQAKMLKLDLDEPLRISFEKHLDDQGQLIADALGAAFDAAPELSHEARVAMLTAAQAALLGGDPPAPPAAAAAPGAPVPPERDLAAEYRAWCEREGVDPDEDDGDQEGDGDGTGGGPRGA